MYFYDTDDDDTFTHMHTKYSHLIIMWWKLVEELLDSKLLSRTVNIGGLILWQTGEIQLDLGKRWHRAFGLDMGAPQDKGPGFCYTAERHF